ncbi:hypothetical protein TRICI_000464 [Trichomonascus ciferrii]|uniref:t-SNARE coiled-coil homology domain-containing protein n=1 Tax=Trichomonascus ciferrii TaxID=44093 RepID=A0A642VDC0_9ASCO|nr:hypothetical protein TRICI_000464 [Trichomonascus ciferrii]
MTTPSKLLLLEEQTKISIEERNRLRTLGMEPGSGDDAEIERSLETVLRGINRLYGEEHAPEDKERIQRVVKNYQNLLEMYKEDPNVDVSRLEYEPPSINYLGSSSVNSTPNKSVRFKENLEETFVQPYHDDPEEQQPRGSDREIYQQQQLTMADQDQHLDRLAESVSRQHELSIQIDDELTSHNALLDDVEALTEGSQSRLETAKRRLDKFSRTAKQNGSMVTIAILLLIFIILVVVLK